MVTAEKLHCRERMTREVSSEKDFLKWEVTAVHSIEDAVKAFFANLVDNWLTFDGDDTA